MRLLFRVMLLACCLMLSACATLVAPTYSPNYEVVDKLKKVDAQHLSVATVKPADANAKVNKITLRGSSLNSPAGTFSSYLENAIISDLQEMGFYDSTSPLRLSATILQNDIDVSGFSTGKGLMEVNIVLTQSGKVVFDKNYLATTEFESSFAGAVAIPKGQSEYPNLVKALLQKIYIDPDFIKVIKK